MGDRQNAVYLPMQPRRHRGRPGCASRPGTNQNSGYKWGTDPSSTRNDDYSCTVIARMPTRRSVPFVHIIDPILVSDGRPSASRSSFSSKLVQLEAQSSAQTIILCPKTLTSSPRGSSAPFPRRWARGSPGRPGRRRCAACPGSASGNRARDPAGGCPLCR